MYTQYTKQAVDINIGIFCNLTSPKVFLKNQTTVSLCVIVPCQLQPHSLGYRNLKHFVNIQNVALFKTWLNHYQSNTVIADNLSSSDFQKGDLPIHAISNLNHLIPIKVMRMHKVNGKSSGNSSAKVS